MSAIALSLPPYYRRFDLPWSPVGEESDRLRKIFLTVACVALVLSTAVPFLPSAEVVHNRGADVAPRLAKLLIERKTPPPPAPVVKPVEPVVDVEPEPKREPKPKPVPPKTESKVAFVPKPTVNRPPPINEARERAAKAGLMAMADELVELRDSPSLDSALSNRTLAKTVGAANRNERSLVTSASGRASTGINTAALSRNTGGGGLAERDVTQVTSPVVAAGAAAGNKAASRTDESSAGQRGRDQIEMIFDRNKAAIYALYRRALREDPSLQGKLVLELTISPQGDVIDCRVVSSELDAPEFESKLVQRVRLFKFGAQQVDTITTTKPIDFFPV